MDKTVNIAIHNVHGWKLDAEMLKAVLDKVRAYVDGGTPSQIDIYPQERAPADAPAYRHPGSIEWIVNIRYHGSPNPQVFTLCALQRAPGAEIEFNS